MAFIGLKHMVASAISAETEGQAITYGTGMVVGKAMQANRTLNRSDNPLYADDSIAENDNGVTGGTLEVGVDDLIDTARAYLLGDTAVTVGTGNDAHQEYDVTDAPAPYVGCGYYRVRRHAGATSFEAFWYHKVQFGDTTDNAATRGQSVEWQTPTITGRIFGVRNDSSLKTKYFRRVSFETEAAAAAWLDSLAGITAQTTQGTTT